jgi:hypothetical protein
MIIVAAGDSFIYGSELQSQKNTFAALLSDQYHYECIAWPGIGNDGIARRTIDAVEKHLGKELFVFVCWTFPGRYEFKFTYDTGQITRDWYSITPWTIEDKQSVEKKFVNQDAQILKDHHDTLNRAKLSGIYTFASLFFKHVGAGEYWEVYSTLKEIVYLQNYLKTNGVRYLFTCADNNFLHSVTVKNSSETIQSLYRQIIQDQESWFWFPAGINPNETQTPRGFYQWALENKYPIGTTHPLEQAHIDAADLLKEKFNDMVKKHLE